MAFVETYRSEVLQSRRDRSRRAFFWARIVGILLMLTIGAVLRSDPALRGALLQAGMDAIMAIADRGPQASRHPPQVGQGRLPLGNDGHAAIKINRPSRDTPAPPDVQDHADTLGRTLAARRVGG